MKMESLDLVSVIDAVQNIHIYPALYIYILGLYVRK